MNEVYEQAKILAERKNIKVSLNIASETLVLEGNPLQLRRLFLNLIDNAIKYTSVAGKIGLEVKREHKNIIVAVSDTGQGMTEDHLSRIFESFYRVDNNEPGNGLGLNIVQSILKIHQGDIRVESKVNHGTTFTVILPMTNI